MSSAKPFKVNVPDEELQRLQERLKAAIYPDQLKNISAWEDGTDLPYFKVSPPHRYLECCENPADTTTLGCSLQLMAQGLQGCVYTVQSWSYLCDALCAQPALEPCMQSIKSEEARQHGVPCAVFLTPQHSAGSLHDPKRVSHAVFCTPTRDARYALPCAFPHPRRSLSSTG
jgi:hypothetical protein